MMKGKEFHEADSAVEPAVEPWAGMDRGVQRFNRG